MEDYEYRRLEMFERSAVEIVMTETNKNQPNNSVVQKLRYINDRIHTRLDRIEARLLKILETSAMSPGPDDTVSRYNVGTEDDSN